ncbi:hypothetical protein KAS79_01065 [Candidatus Parcubacteria bacterium]|nr:hypothetical protein [Candidatus Parcubacteria bacterium]
MPIIRIEGLPEGESRDGVASLVTRIIVEKLKVESKEVIVKFDDKTEIYVDGINIKKQIGNKILVYVDFLSSQERTKRLRDDLAVDICHFVGNSLCCNHDGGSMEVFVGEIDPDDQSFFKIELSEKSDPPSH